MSTKIQYDLELPGLSDVADITVISNDIQKIADELDLRPRMVDGVIPFEILFSHKDAALTILNEADVYSQLINSGTQYINFIDTNGENTALIKKERTSGNNGDNTLSILLRGLNGNYYGMTIHDNGLAQRITGVTPTVSGLDDETIPTMNYLNSSKATKLVHTDLAETITGQKTFSGSDLIRTIDIPNYGISYEIKHSDVELGKAIANARYWNEILSRDKNNNTLWQIEYDHLTNGNSHVYLNMSNDQGNKVALGLEKNNNVIYAVAPTPTDSAPSNAIVTKANVMSTDGKLNNLVHTIANETIGGEKKFTGLVKRITGLVENPTSYTENTAISMNTTDDKTIGSIMAGSSSTHNYNIMKVLQKGTNNYCKLFIRINSEGRSDLIMETSSQKGYDQHVIYTFGA